jgi:hypothetical protein
LSVNSSKLKPAQTLAKPDLLEPLRELANLRDDPKDFERFVKRRPRFVPVLERDLPGVGPIGKAQIPNKFWTLHERREALRRIWRGSSLTLSELLLPNEPPEKLRDQEAYKDRDDETGQQTGWIWEPQVNLDWQRREFIYEPRTDFQRALYGLFRQSARAKVCGNSECPAPFFIAHKPTQRYCSEACAEVFQREWKRRWWAAHGARRRRSRKRSARKRATR